MALNLQLHLTVTLTTGKMVAVGVARYASDKPHLKVVIKNIFIKKKKNLYLQGFLLVSAHVNPLISNIQINTSSF